MNIFFNANNQNFSGIAIYRLFLIKFPLTMTVAKARFKTMAVIEALCVLSYAILFKWYQAKIKAKLFHDCFHEVGSSDLMTIETIVTTLSLVTIMEMVIYCFITYELYKHNKLMKMILSDEAVRQRHTKNAVNLVSQMYRFVLETIFILLVFICNKYLYGGAAPQILNTSHILMEGLWAIMHLTLSQKMKSEMRSNFEAISNCLQNEF